MTEDEILLRVREVQDAADDFEAAHGLEDKLHADVLRAIAVGDIDNPAICAALALLTVSVKFPRHCA